MRSLLRFIQRLFQNSYMIRSIIVRDLRSRYVGSLFGFFWAFIDPLVMTLMYTFVFSFVLGIRYSNLGPGYGAWAQHSYFAVWLLAGVLPWGLLAESLMRNSNIVMENAQLITKTIFPSEILPLTVVLANLVNLAIGLSMLLVLMLITGIEPSNYVWYLPLILLVQILVAVGVSWMVASINVYLRDTAQALRLFINLWFFGTPIIYRLEGARFELLEKWLKLNPMYYVVEGYRSALISGYQSDVLQSFSYSAYTLGLSLFLFVLGGLCFRHFKAGFADVL